MSETKSSVGERLSKCARVALLAGIAVVVALLIVGPQRGGFDYPLTMDYAQANGIAAAPGYLALATSAGSVFYIIDTNKQVICTYKMAGGELRLVSARKFDYDGDIPDGSLPIIGGVSGKQLKALDGTDGFDRSTAKDYGEGLKKAMEAGLKKK